MDNPNSQRNLLGEVLDRCKLHAASLSEHAAGPEYTYCSGSSFTAVDYIFTDIVTSSCVKQCWIHADQDINSSDHLPLSAKFSCSVAKQVKHDSNWIRID